MRYDDWDVILFPKDSHVPIQEYKTACYVSPEEYGRQLPTLTSYISSLPPSTPFRISVHSWATATAAKASALIESRRKPSQKVVYLVQVIVDGSRVFRGFFDIASKWPQEIAHEKRSLSSVEQPTSQRKPCLEFPPFHQQTLMQNSWDSRDPNGRIRIMLSEQLVSKTASPGELDLGATNDIVCFSFQHAPKDVLEQAGISWPIRNPLYLPNALDRATLSLRTSTSPSVSWTAKPRTQAADVQMLSPLSHASKPTFVRPQNPEPHRRPHSHLPSISQFAKPPVGAKNGARAGIWDDAFSPFGDSGDDISMGTWSTKRTTSGSTSDMAMPDYMYTSHSSRQAPPWRSMPRYEHSTSTEWDDHQPRKERERQLVVTLRDDQLGQIIEAISPPKQSRELPQDFVITRHEHAGRPPTAHAYYPPKMGPPPPMNHPSSAAMARTSSYPDLNSALRNASNKQSPDQQYPHNTLKDRPPMMYHPSITSNKENCPPSQSRLPTPYPHANRVPTPNPFSQRLPTFGSDVSMRDPSANSSMYRFNRSEAPPPWTELGKAGSAHAPSTVNIRSRKEGMTSDSPKLSDQAMRHDQSLLPALSVETSTTQRPTSKGQDRSANNMQKKVPDLVEIIDVDAIDPNLRRNASLDNDKLSPFKPIHKSGASISSVDSTGRLERQLFSALGEELGSFDQHIDTTGMGSELAQALSGTTAHSELGNTSVLNPAASDFEPSIKRKRQGTLGGERDKSPMTKKEKAELVDEEARVD
ncbi:hypothetical protein EJ02DRAFT_432261 [Clathrospora elynae]|uniref:Uncharacterized protein n=1 Tax=Clathrospora elynae TaxID=706981 RepID=A0A6A5SXT9_9PLEO|nr:hypothetical protein EJ02DRAFT_432261 [Clathrospora elynae]